MFKKFSEMTTYEYASSSWKHFFLNRLAATLSDVLWAGITIIVIMAVVILLTMLQYKF